jgi:hypothetical protein
VKKLISIVAVFALAASFAVTATARTGSDTDDARPSRAVGCVGTEPPNGRHRPAPI